MMDPGSAAYKKALAGDAAFFGKHTNPAGEHHWVYDPLAPSPDRWIYDRIYGAVYRALDKQIGRHARIVDLGCGPGGSSLWLAAQGHHVVGIDACAERIDIARKIAGRNGEVIKQSGGSLAYICGDFFEYEPPTPLDAVFSQKTFHHVPDPVKLLRRYLGFMADNGVVMVLDQVGHGSFSAIAAAAVGAMFPPYTCDVPFVTRCRLLAYRTLLAVGLRRDDTTEQSPLEDVGSDHILPAFREVFRRFRAEGVDPLRLVFANAAARPKNMSMVLPWINLQEACRFLPSLEVSLMARRSDARLPNPPQPG